MLFKPVFGSPCFRSQTCTLNGVYLACEGLYNTAPTDLSRIDSHTYIHTPDTWAKQNCFLYPEYLQLCQPSIHSPACRKGLPHFPPGPISLPDSVHMWPKGGWECDSGLANQPTPSLTIHLASGSGTGVDLRQPMTVAPGLLLQLWKEVLSSYRGAKLQGGTPGAAGDHRAPSTEIERVKQSPGGFVQNPWIQPCLKEDIAEASCLLLKPTRIGFMLFVTES